MTTAEPRYQVFISSTYRDLLEERQQVMQALLELDCIPAGMELFPAADEDQWTLIKKVIDESDYYVLIVGGRYGSTTAEGISYTEKEFDYAIEIGVPILAFLHENPGQIAADRSELDDVARKRLVAFREKIQTGRTCRTWASADELGAVVSRSLVKSIRAKPAEGWVRGRFAANTALLSQVNDLRDANELLKLEIAILSTTAPDDAKEFASGSAPIGLRGTFRYVTANGRSSELLSWAARPTWDEVFGMVGPLMYEDCSETAMSNELGRYVWYDEQMKGRKLQHSFISNDSLNTVKIQLLALGLIQKGNINSTATDRGMYWKLTPYGETYLIKLRAIKKDDLPI